MHPLGASGARQALSSGSKRELLRSHPRPRGPRTRKTSGAGALGQFVWALRAAGGGDHGCGQQTDAAEREFAPIVEPFSQCRWQRWKRERVEVADMEVRFLGEEDVVAACEVP